MSWATHELTRGAVPLWAQLADALRTAIGADEFGTGDVLPSESELVTRFGISRATARNALNHLASEGLVERRAGQGTIVLPPRVEQPLNLLTSFSEDMRSRGLEPGYGSVTTTVERLRPPAASELGVAPGEQGLRIERLLLSNGHAIARSTSWLSPLLVPPSEAAPVLQHPESSLYRWLETEYGLRVTYGTEVIGASVADHALAEQLGLQLGDAVLVANRTAKTQDGTAVEYVERQYRADRYSYRVELVRP